VNKKDYERREREEAETKLNDAAESGRRKARIGQLWRELKSGDLVSKSTDESDLKEHPLVVSLVELTDLEKREIDHLEPFRRDWEQIHAHYPEQLENLRSASTWAEVKQLAKTGAIKLPKPKAKKTWEYKRRGYNRDGIGEIERQFGRVSSSVPKVVPAILPLIGPNCLDEMLRGGGVNMRRLQVLFGMHRDRFPKRLPRFVKGRERLYDYRAVVKIMDALLSQKQSKRKRPGRPLRTWLSKPDFRTRVLSGIEARINSGGIPVQKKIRTAFLRVLRRHRPSFRLNKRSP
jgi:hypothetical protein